MASALNFPGPRFRKRGTARFEISSKCKRVDGSLQCYSMRSLYTLHSSNSTAQEYPALAYQGTPNYATLATLSLPRCQQCISQTKRQDFALDVIASRFTDRRPFNLVLGSIKMFPFLFVLICSGVKKSLLHGGRRQPMCDPEGCATVWGAVGGGDPHPPLG